MLKKIKLTNYFVICITLAFLLIFSGCTATTVNPVNQEGNDNTPQSEEKTSTEVQSEENVSDEPFEIIFMDRPAPLTLELHETRKITESNKHVIGKLPMTGPAYLKNFRIQPTYFTANGKVEAHFEFANTSNEPILLNDDSICFVRLDNEGNNISGSKLQGEPIVVQPNEIKNLVVTATDLKSMFVFVSIGDMRDLTYYFENPNIYTESITDAKPHNDSDAANLIISEKYHVVGTKNSKAQVIESKMVQNEKIGSLNKPTEGSLLLVKVRVANSTDNKMTISSITEYSAFLNDNFEPFDMNTFQISKDDLNVLGENALPEEIAPHTLAEGYIPVIIEDFNKTVKTEIVTNLGKINLVYIEKYTPW